MLAGTRTLAKGLPGTERVPGMDSPGIVLPSLLEAARIAERPDAAIHLGIIAFVDGVEFHPDDSHIYSQIAEARRALQARKGHGSWYLDDGNFYPPPFTTKNPPYEVEARLSSLLRARRNARNAGSIAIPG